MIERFNSTVTNCLKASIDEQKDWVDCLQSIAMAYRAGVHASTGKSPYEVMFGLRMRMPVHLLTQPYDEADGEIDVDDDDVVIEEDTRPYEEIFSDLENARKLIHQSCSVNISTAQARQAKDYDARHRGAPLQVGDKIMNYNTKAKQRKGNRMAPNWTGPYTIVKVHNNGNYTVRNAKGDVLATKMCASNVKLWNEPTNWENEPAPDWISAQQLDVSEPIIPPDTEPKKFKKSKRVHNESENAEPWISSQPYTGDSSEDEDYADEPPVKQAQYPSSDVSTGVKRPRVDNSSAPVPSSAPPAKKVRFMFDTAPESALPESTGLDKLQNALVKKAKKKRSLAAQKERKAAERENERKRKNNFFNQMLNLDAESEVKENTVPDSDSSSDIQITDVKEGNDFKFNPLQLNHRRAICERVSLILRKTTMAHSQVGESLETREPRVTHVKGDGNCLFRALCVAVTGWETGHMKIRQLVCDHINDVGPYNSKESSDGPIYLRDNKMRKDAVFGTDVEIFSAAQVLSTDIYVYHKYGENGLKWLYFPCVHGSGNWRNAIYLDNRTGNGVTGHFDYVTGLKP